MTKTTTMNTTTSIAKLLNLTNDEYWDGYVSLYIRWATQYASEFDIPLQSLMANTAISVWYGKWHEELAYQAYETLLPTYGKITFHKAKEIYATIMIDIYKSYPKHLFDTARKLTIINDPHDHTAN